MRRGGLTRVIVGCALVLALALTGLYRARTRLGVYALRSLTTFAYVTLERRLDALGKQIPVPGERRGAVFGDSVFAGNEFTPGFTATLVETLKESGRPVRVLDAAYPGLSAFQFYYAADRVLAVRPQFAVVEVNLRTFAPDWQQNPALQFRELAAGLSLRRALRMREALATQTLSPLAPVAYRLLETTDSLFLFDALRRFGTDSLAAVGTKVNDILGLATRSRADQDEEARRRAWNDLLLNREHTRQWYGRDFTATPAAVVLRALADELRAAGVVTVFVVTPLDRERLRQWTSLRTLDSRIDALRQVLGAEPEDWVQPTGFHHEDFIDGIHVNADGVKRVASDVGLRLRPRLGLPDRRLADSGVVTRRGRSDR